MYDKTSNIKQAHKIRYQLSEYLSIIRTKFHTLIPLKSCTAITSPKFRLGGTFSKNVLIKDF